MDTQTLLSVAFTSIILAVLIGGLFLYMVFNRKAKIDKQDYSQRISSFESLYKQGKLSKEEYNNIRLTLMRKQGIDLPPELMNMNSAPKPLRTSIKIDEKKESNVESKEERTPNSTNS